MYNAVKDIKVTKPELWRKDAEEEEKKE